MNSIFVIYLYLYIWVYYCSFLMLSELFRGSKFYKSLQFYASTPPFGVKMVYEFSLFWLPAPAQI